MYFKPISRKSYVDAVSVKELHTILKQINKNQGKLYQMAKISEETVIIEYVPYDKDVITKR